VTNLRVIDWDWWRIYYQGVGEYRMTNQISGGGGNWQRSMVGVVLKKETSSERRELCSDNSPGPYFIIEREGGYILFRFSDALRFIDHHLSLSSSIF